MKHMFHLKSYVLHILSIISEDERSVGRSLGIVDEQLCVVNQKKDREILACRHILSQLNCIERALYICSFFLGDNNSWN